MKNIEFLPLISKLVNKVYLGCSVGVVKLLPTSVEVTENWLDARGSIKANNGNRAIAIVLDNRVFIAPSVMEPIHGGFSSISGNFTREEAEFLVLRIRLGALNYPLKIVEEQIGEQ